ncbi:MAG: ATP-binding protein [Mycoplasmataceae bacterium]|nr:ATP-binding protein [Mycoplasmataceae bacterium]
MEVIRKRYLEKLEKLEKVDLIKVIIGIRRCGKTTLLKQYMDFLLTKYEKNQVIFLNFEDRNNKHLTDVETLAKYLDSNILPNKQMFLFFDEIQNVVGFEELILSYYSTNKLLDIYITGSNSNMLSAQIATKFTGRDITIKVLPLNFMEFYELHKNNENTKYTLFEVYRKNGGFPILKNFLNDTKLVDDMINGIVETIINRDLIPHFKIKNFSLLRKILEYAMENFGNEFSTDNVVEYLKRNKLIDTISHHTINSYLECLVQCFLLMKINRLDIRGLKVLKTLYKFYSVDINMRNIIANKDYRRDLGKQLENIVFIDLYTRFNKINIGSYYYRDNNKLQHLECDFVCQNNMDKVFIQVCWDILDDRTYEREMKILEKIKDGRRILLNNSKINRIVNGIQIIDVVDFLLAEKIDI